MAGQKQTSFSSDECQVLLDIIEKVGMDGLDAVVYTKEERVVYVKLKKAGRFYVPDQSKKD